MFHVVQNVITNFIETENLFILAQTITWRRKIEYISSPCDGLTWRFTMAGCKKIKK